MVTYLKEQDAYKPFLVGGHPANRSNIGEARSKTDHAIDSVDQDMPHTMSRYLPSLPERYCTKIDCVPEKSRM